MSKEQVYDNEINPLMAQIIDICRREKIALVASFAIPVPGDGGLRCTTCLLDEPYMKDVASPDDFFAAKSILVEGFIAYTRRIR